MSDFVGKWLDTSKKRNWRNLSRRTIKTDRWDEQDLERIFSVMPDFGKAKDSFCDSVDTGNAATGDTFFSFFKGFPRNVDPHGVRPDYLINGLVRDELQDMTEWEELRALGTVGDDVNSALAFITMKDDLETLFDKVKTEQELAKELAKKMQELAQLEAEEKSIDQMMEDMHGQEEPDEDALKDLQDQADQNAQKQQALEDGIQKDADAIREGLEAKSGSIQQSLRDGLKKAADEAHDMQSIDQTWGTEAGAMQRLPAEQRLNLAKRIKDRPKLKRLAQLVGPMKRVMFGEQRKKAEHARDEIFNVEKGDDIGRLIPQALINLHHPRLRKLFIREFHERSLMQYELKGEEKMGLGGIVCAIDNSGSMSGDREIWAKAVGLSLLHLARAQKRSFKGIHFGSRSEIAEFDFMKPEDFGMEKIFEFAELFFGGGTDFEAPLTVAVKHLRAEFDKTGKIKGDIVFITDGYCNVNEKWLEEFKEEQEALGFQCFGVLIGADAWGDTSVLSRICDNKIVTIKSLSGPDDVRDIFGQIHSF